MLRFRSSVESDMLKVLDIRNNPEVMKGYYTQKEPITKQEHLEWWYSRNIDWFKGIIELDGKVIGMFNIGQLDHWSPEIGLSILPEYWGKGYGKETVKEAMNIIKVKGRDYCHTTVRKDNKRSMKMFKSLGFTVLGDAREGEVWLTKRIS